MELISPVYGMLLQFLGLLLFMFWVYALFDCLKSTFKEPNQKLIWLVLIILVPFLGPLMYVGLSKKGKKKRTFTPDFNRKIGRAHV
jgi:hypothetical protein